MKKNMKRLVLALTVGSFMGQIRAQDRQLSPEAQEKLAEYTSNLQDREALKQKHKAESKATRLKLKAYKQQLKLQQMQSDIEFLNRK